MQYSLQKRFTTTFEAHARPRVLIAIPERPLASLYKKYLEREYQVIFSDIHAIRASLEAHRPQAAIVYTTSDPTTIRVIATLSRQFPLVRIITLGYLLEDSVLDALMSAGISSHVNRAFTKVEDMLPVIKQTLTR